MRTIQKVLKEQSTQLTKYRNEPLKTLGGPNEEIQMDFSGSNTGKN